VVLDRVQSDLVVVIELLSNFGVRGRGVGTGSFFVGVIGCLFLIIRAMVLFSC